MADRITANGAICDRCDQGIATKANYGVESYEYVCDGCLTPAERVAFGLEGTS
jgi:hypothetical protein